MRAWLYLTGLLWLNAYLVRHVFTLTYTGATHSMHGFWIALGRAVGNAWWAPGWVHEWAGGMPVELTYAPLVPWLSNHIGLYAVFGLIFALGPAAVFLMAWQLSGKPGWSFVAAAAYSLCSPTELLLPDAGFAWAHFLDARRMYVSLVWDEAPHQLALAMVCLAVAAWAAGRPRAATAAIALGALANPFGVTGAMLAGLCFVLVTGNWRLVAVTGAVAYALVSPFYPPSLLGVLRANSVLAPESAWTPRSWIALAALAAALALAWFLTRRWEPVRRFALLFACIATALPVAYYKWDAVLLQQPGRYKSEMELGLVLAAVFLLERVLSPAPRWVLALLACAGIYLGVEQTVRHRRFARNAIQQKSPEGSIEQAAARNAHGMVFTVGSLAQWMNVYAPVRQYSGGSFTTLPNPVQQRIALEMTQERSPERFIHFMQAAGVDSVIIPGRNSPEFWKPFAGDVFAGRLPVAWEDRDTRLYRIPRRRQTQAHSIPSLPALEPYVQLLEDPAAPPLDVKWLTRNHARIEGAWRPADMVLVHMNWHRGWKAYLDGSPVQTGPDGLGQLVIVPRGNGVLELKYDGWPEGWLTRLLALLGLFLWCQAPSPFIYRTIPSSAPPRSSGRD